MYRDEADDFCRDLNDQIIFTKSVMQPLSLSQQPDTKKLNLILENQLVIMEFLQNQFYRKVKYR